MYYKIQVCLVPFEKDNYENPYFWYISKCGIELKSEYNEFMVCNGWSKTLEEAWQATHSQYTEIVRSKNYSY